MSSPRIDRARDFYAQHPKVVDRFDADKREGTVLGVDDDGQVRVQWAKGRVGIHVDDELIREAVPGSGRGAPTLRPMEDAFASVRAFLPDSEDSADDAPIRFENH